MRAKTVYENINFERGKDTKSSIGIGLSRLKNHSVKENPDHLDELEEEEYIEEFKKLFPETLYWLTGWDFYYNTESEPGPEIDYLTSLFGPIREKEDPIEIGDQEIYIAELSDGAKFIEMGLEPGYSWFGNDKAALYFFNQFPEKIR
jgi:hypothetical protein